MRIFLAGGSGAIGKRLVPLLVAHGHDVVATTTTDTKLPALRAAGAEPVLLDVLDRDAVMDAVVRAAPDAVVHEATALADMGQSFRKMDEMFAGTNRLRTEGTDHLLEAARAAGAERFVAQSYAGWPYQRTGPMVKSEDDPLDPDPLPAARRVIEAIKHLESTVTGADGIEGIVLRYGGFYGPGTSMAEGGVHLDAVRKRRFPIVGDGTGVWSFVHIDDAAAATLAAIEHGRRGIYNIVDDDPAPVREWLPVLARDAGAKPPRHVPVWLGRLLAGDVAVAMMTSVRGASNAKARRELGWQPRYPSWRQGFATLTDDSEHRARSS
ncbi:MAG TPA: NAD(P)-dependent oxidoreductase [Acidimicrobiia bacterium]|jgi:nucleoside-diphosphate-sugar epimerase|nr:NAD(P)-dependent oxidoreductase [Acidimicrobiia bacterium]